MRSASLLAPRIAALVAGLLVFGRGLAEAQPTEGVAHTDGPASDTTTDTIDAPLSVEIVGAPRASYAARVQTTGTRDERPTRDLPQSISVINRDLIEDVGGRKTDDVAQLAPGVQLYSGYGGTWEDYTVRGFRIWSGTTYRNGYLSGYSGANTNDLISVERIEILRGPASALYGPGLPGGSLNFITKAPSRERRATLGISVGSFGTYRADLDATGPLASNASYRLTAAGETTSGYRDFNDFSRATVNPVVTYDFDRSTSMLVELSAYRVRYRADPRGVPILHGDPFSLPNARSFVEPSLPLADIGGGLARIEVTHALSSSLRLRIGAQDKIGYYGEKTINTGPLADDGHTLARVVTLWRSNSADTMLQTALVGDVAIGPTTHGITVGADYGHERVGWQSAVADPATNPYEIDVTNPHYGAPLPSVAFSGEPDNHWLYDVFGVYASDLAKVSSDLTLMVSGRTDVYSQSSFTSTVHDTKGETALSGRAGAVYRPIEWLSFFGSAGTGFWPSLGVAADGGVLRPEHSLTYEVGSRVALDRELVTMDVAAFHVRNRDIAVADPAHPDFQVQRGEAVSEGVEVTGTSRIGAGLRLLVNYAYLDAHVSADPNPDLVGTRMPLAARHSGSFWLKEELPVAASNLLGLAFGGVATSERALLDVGPNRTTIPGYARFDAVLSYGSRALRSALRVENLLDTRYVRTGTDKDGVLYGAPRNFLLTTTLTL